MADQAVTTEIDVYDADIDRMLERHDWGLLSLTESESQWAEGQQSYESVLVHGYRCGGGLLGGRCQPIKHWSEPPAKKEQP